MDRRNGRIKCCLYDSGSLRVWDIYGNTSQEMTSVDDNSVNYIGASPAMSVDEAGTVYVFYTKDEEGTSSTSVSVVGRYSTDGMLTWNDLDPYVRSARTDADIPRVFCDPAVLAPSTF